MCLPLMLSFAGRFNIHQPGRPDASRHSRIADLDERRGRGRVRSRADGLSEIPCGRGRSAHGAVGGRRRIRAGALPQGLLRHAVLQAGERRNGAERGAERAAVQRKCDRTRTRTYRRAGCLDRRRSRPRARRVGADPQRAPARCAGVSPRAFQQFLARAAGRDARLGRARETGMERRAAGLRHHPVLPLFRAGGMRRLRGG